MKINFSIKAKFEKNKLKGIPQNVLFSSMLKLVELSKTFAVADTGFLRNSIKFFPFKKGENKYTYFVNANYSAAVEFGTRPHIVSANVLKGWARRVLGNEKIAFLVANKIKKKGTEAKPFVRPALSQVKNIWITKFWKQELEKI
jgi:hypothetical protein